MAETKQTNKKILKHRDKPIPETKIKRVKELADLIKNKKTILVASIKNLPAAQLQEIGKTLRGNAILKVPKKNLLFRAMDASGNEGIKKLEKKINADIAILFSDKEGFELSADLIKNKSPAKAKPGQIAPTDIEIQAGPTDLIPGPAISELGALGIQIQIEKGKITIKEPKVIVKEGKEISKEAADVMSKLDIKPFSIGLLPVASFDNESDTLYLDINIDSEQAVKDLKESFGKALPFAVEIGYINDETIGFMISKAAAHEKAVENLLGTDEKQAEEPKEEKKEESKDDNASEGSEENKKEAEEKKEEPKEENTQDKKEEKKEQAEESEQEKKEESKEEKKEESQQQTQTPEKTQENKSQEEKQ